MCTSRWMRTKRAELRGLDKVRIPAISVIVGSGYLKFRGCVSRDSHGLRNHTYLIPELRLESCVGVGIP